MDVRKRKTDPQLPSYDRMQHPSPSPGKYRMDQKEPLVTGFKGSQRSDKLSFANLQALQRANPIIGLKWVYLYTAPRSVSPLVPSPSPAAAASPVRRTTWPNQFLDSCERFAQGRGNPITSHPHPHPIYKRY
ncbi:hypothetical protein BHE74_00016906 [Ensete ventricosum]|nr:hypothetical protein BHE74_00016906 [Ensete ventricosum]